MKTRTIRFIIAALAGVLAFTQQIRAEWTARPLCYEQPAMVAADSSGSNIWLVGKGQYPSPRGDFATGGFWATRNGGVGWDRVDEIYWNNSENYRRMRLYTPLDPNGDTLLVYVDVLGQVYGSYRSTNGGQSWTRILGVSSYPFEISPVNRNLWLQPYSASRFLQSTNAGQTWDTLTGGRPFPGIFAFSVIGEQTVFTFDRAKSDTNRGIWQSDDFGITWRQILSPQTLFPHDSVRISSFQSMSYGTLFALIAISNTPHLYFSDNNGQGWSEIITLPPNFTWTGSSAVFEDAHQPGSLYLTGSATGGIARSIDYGRSWSVGGYGLPVLQDSTVNMYIQPFSGHLYLCLRDHGLYRSMDHGASWQSVAPPPYVQRITSYSFFQSDISVSGNVYADTTWLWQPGEIEWHRIPAVGPDSTDPDVSVSPMLSINGDTLVRIISGQGGGSVHPYHLFRATSTDRGRTWDYFQISGSDSNTVLLDARIIRDDPVTLAAFLDCSDHYRLSLTSDFGSTWQPITMPRFPDIYFSEFAALNSHLIGRGLEGALWETPDSGATWNQIMPEMNWTNSNMIVVGDSALYVGSQRYLLKWNAAGWDTVGQFPGNELDGYYEFVDIGEARGMLLHAWMASGSQFYLSPDYGLTWTPLALAYSPLIHDSDIWNMHYDRYRDRIWATSNTGPCYIDVSDISAATTGDGTLHFKPADFTVLSAYPNPFNGTTRIRYDLERPGPVNLTLYNLTGQRVRTLVDQRVESGSHELSLSSDGLASGTYVIRLAAPGTLRAEKILVVK
jgi:photosystem II stability/assembly factor-like uncharacterized protein